MGQERLLDRLEIKCYSNESLENNSAFLYMQFAVIERDGKQYLVKQGDRLKFDPIAAEPNSSVIFDKVLIRGSAESALIGKPYVEGATVEAKVLSHGRADKVLVMKYHNKTRYRRKRGHRQPYTEIQIVKV